MPDHFPLVLPAVLPPFPQVAWRNQALQILGGDIKAGGNNPSFRERSFQKSVFSIISVPILSTKRSISSFVRISVTQKSMALPNSDKISSGAAR